MSARMPRAGTSFRVDRDRLVDHRGLGFSAGDAPGMGEAPVSMYLHFFASLLICGLIAAAYPFL